MTNSSFTMPASNVTVSATFTNKHIPLTLKALTEGTIVVDSPKSGMQYSKNGGAKTAMTETTTIDVAIGDTVSFYGSGTSITSYKDTNINGGTAEVKVYGNIMSLVDEEGFATATSLADFAFYGLFQRKLSQGNSKLKDASELLLPADTLAPSCYRYMFYRCTSLTAAPALPATTLAEYCYASMFYGCTSLKAVTCLATDVSATECTNGWLYNVAANGTFTTPSSTNWSLDDVSGIPEGWTRVDAN